MNLLTIFLLLVAIKLLNDKSKAHNKSVVKRKIFFHKN